MVYAEIGMSVWYYQGGNTKEPFAGIVTAVYNELVDLYILPPASAGAVREGVMHVDDPRAADKRRQAFVNEVGLWDYTDLTATLLGSAPEASKVGVNFRKSLEKEPYLAGADN